MELNNSAPCVVHFMSMKTTTARAITASTIAKILSNSRSPFLIDSQKVFNRRAYNKLMRKGTFEIALNEFMLLFIAVFIFGVVLFIGWRYGLFDAEKFKHVIGLTG